MREFRELKTWEKAHRLTLLIYKLTSTYPREEMYGLTHQMRRCAVSIPSNIAEGCGRSSNKDFIRFLYMLLGSFSELDYQLMLSSELHYLDPITYDEVQFILEEVKKMLNSYIKYLN